MEFVNSLSCCKTHFKLMVDPCRCTFSVRRAYYCGRKMKKTLENIKHEIEEQMKVIEEVTKYYLCHVLFLAGEVDKSIFEIAKEKKVRIFCLPYML